jgi:hypothetical protein
MAAQTPASTTSATSRRVGYVVAALVNAVLLYLVNVWPGWQAVPFLTEGMDDVLDVVNLSLTATVVVNLAYLVYDPAWFTAAGQLVLSVIALAVAIRLLQVFPFDFSAYAVDWELVTRVVLGFAVFGSAVGIVASLVKLVRALVRPT